MQLRIIFSFEIDNWCKWLDCNMETNQELLVFTVFLTGAR